MRTQNHLLMWLWWILSVKNRRDCRKYTLYIDKECITLCYNDNMVKLYPSFERRIIRETGPQSKVWWTLMRHLYCCFWNETELIVIHVAYSRITNQHYSRIRTLVWQVSQMSGWHYISNFKKTCALRYRSIPFHKYRMRRSEIQNLQKQ